MYISNLSHFLDESGNIPTQIPVEVREMANFLALVVDATTILFPGKSILVGVRCFQPGCKGQVFSTLLNKNDDIEWECPICKTAGRINSWQNTKWDNSKS
jgi:hypothetical protein